MENDANWLKRQRVDQPLPRDRSDTESPHETVNASYGDANHTFATTAATTGSHAAMGTTIQATPTAPPVVRPVPVTNTPLVHPHHSGYATGLAGLSHQPPAPEMPPSPSFHPLRTGGEDDVAVAAVPAPYSPVTWNRHHGDNNDEGHDDGIDESAEPVPMSEWKHHGYGESDDGHHHHHLSRRR